MKNDRMQTERRQHQRYRVQKNALALLRNKSIYPGHITEISLGGMVFQYHSRNGKTSEASEIDIISANYTEAALIRHLGIKTISDLAVSEKKAGEATQLRKQAVRFGKLSRSQRSQLKNFIRTYSSSRV
jgi:c-di-GMP-binding flagellar brake protein YcgR